MYEPEREINGREADEREQRELAAIEAELAAFRPAESRIDRDRTMYLAGRASVASDVAPTPSKTATRRWAAAFTAMTATAGCLLLAVVVQHRSIVALRADVEKTTEQPPARQAPAKPDQPTKQPEPDTPKPPQQKTLVNDSNSPELDQHRFDFSEKRLLALADSGTLTARSLMMLDEPITDTPTKSTTPNDWPQQTYESRSQPLPYYKLLKQMQDAGI